MQLDPTQAIDGLPGELARRVWIQNVNPEVDGGRFPIKRTVGESVRVTADVFADGHDALTAVLAFRPASAAVWHEISMMRRVNDIWTAEFQVVVLEPYVYTIRAWVDHFVTWQNAILKKFRAGQDVASDLQEGGLLVEEVSRRAPEPDRTWLAGLARMLCAPGPHGDLVARALAEDLGGCMARYPDRSRETEYRPVLEVLVERERARCGAWYEMFPRSAGPDPGRSATFREAEARLPAIARMGFDVLYLPPIHPIGRTNRKGANNTVTAGPSDPGSPWAIGAAEGGHKAVHPDLGGLEDFDHFVATAGAHGIEIAMDIAFQCSPDHPYVREHPEWFRRRPDGTIKYAENPPKRYEDIYPLNFESDAWPELWSELKSVLLFWARRGVRIFRVDNPHTKPLRFWGWLISEVRSVHPDVVFLSEAFTRPKVMYALAKAGFSQSYTYFTWRNTKQEIVEYLDELTRSGVEEYFRPNLFANTPDILPEFLQFGGRAAFQARLVLAATLGASYGIYSGYELCEAKAVPGTEEYLDSEKYQIRHRDWDQPGNIVGYVTRVNAIRRTNHALASNQCLRFHPVDNEHLLAYSKTTGDLSNIVLVVVNTDPHHVHDGWVELPLQDYGIASDEIFQVHDLIGEGRYLWQGPRNYVRLDPAASPAQIYRLRRRMRTEKDFEYFV